MSKGKYIMFCDSDDVIEKDWCRSLYNLYTNNHNSVAVCGFNIINYRNNKSENIFKIFNKDKKINYLKVKDFYELYDKNLLNYPWNKIYDEKIIKENKIKFEENITLGEDLLFNLKYFEFVKGDIVVLNECKYNYILRDNESLDNKYYKDLFGI